uniref:Aminopeptidase n=1 Tax=Pithovirus LCPAC403 TaxID=2506596 RepID=A0A481ZAN0_9VIRU|nr:MAG: aminopeptidase [Pithovirus LCPAC403]
MSEHISPEKLGQFKAKFENNAWNRVMQNVISKNNIEDLVINRDQVSKDQKIFSKQLEPRVKVTDQKASGRCWLFAALSVVRRKVIKKYNLDPGFELSQSYLFFWDKLEKMNFNLECIMELHELDINSRLVNKILCDPVSDGGQWDMFVNLVHKYGVVPKSAFDETYHSDNSRSMNSLLITKFKEAALKVRALMKKSEKEARKYKEDFIQFVYDTLRKMLGTPPTHFVWEYIDKDKKYYRVEVNSPQQFFSENVSLILDDYVCLIHDPRSEHNYYKLYTVQYLGNVLGGHPVKYLNVPIESMKDVTLASLKGDDAVWFGNDVGKEKFNKVMRCGIKQYGELLGTTFNMSKEDRLNTGDSVMTHAMVFSGFNLVKSERKEFVSRLEVENSWGKKFGDDDDGYYTMSIDWFTEYVYEVVIHKKYATSEMMTALESKNITVLPPWDPYGALAL